MSPGWVSLHGRTPSRLVTLGRLSPPVRPNARFLLTGSRSGGRRRRVRRNKGWAPALGGEVVLQIARVDAGEVDRKQAGTTGKEVALSPVHLRSTRDPTSRLVSAVNEEGDSGLRARREIIRRVVEWEDFSTCWPDEAAAVRGHVARVPAR